MQDEFDYPAITFVDGFRRRRLVQKQWPAAVSNGSVTAETAIEAQMSPSEKSWMLAGEFGPLRQLLTGSLPAAGSMGELIVEAAVPATESAAAGTNRAESSAAESSAPGRETRLTAFGSRLDRLASLIAEAQLEWAALVTEIDSAPIAPTAAAKPAPADEGGAGAEEDPPGSQDLAQRYNAARTLDDLAQLQARLRAQSFTNDRTRDIAQLSESEVDRFWLIEDPKDPDRALLLPGMAAKKSWSKMRTVSEDHPFAYHFNLSQGDRLLVIEPAQLRRTEDLGWALESKGALSGTL